jgi:predicted GNAT family N-acyltransferase
MEVNEVHSGVFPADVHAEDNILARIRKRSDEHIAYEEIQVWRMSPLGIELVPAAKTQQFKKGDPVELEITLIGQRSHYNGLVVNDVVDTDDLVILYVRLSNKPSLQVEGGERRNSDRWLCGDQFLPTCICATPGRFNDFVYFQIRDISSTGIQIACSLRNKFLLIGMNLDLQISLPLVSNISISVKIKRINIRSESGKDYLSIGAEYQEISQNSKNALGQYLIQFGNVSTLDDLRNSKFIPQSMSKGVDFYFLKSEEDYREVLELRLSANAEIGHISPGITVDDMADTYDSRARIVVAKYQGQIIATARMLYNQLEDKLEQEQYVKWPSSLPRKDQVLEMSRAATHKSFRKDDVLATLFGFIAAACALSGREWVVISSTDELVPFYTKLGWKKTELHYEHPTFGNVHQNVLMANIYDVLCGKDVHPLYWNLIWKEAAQHVVGSKSFSPKGIDKLRMSIYSSLAPISKFFVHRKNSR